MGSHFFYTPAFNPGLYRPFSGSGSGFTSPGIGTGFQRNYIPFQFRYDPAAIFEGFRPLADVQDVIPVDGPTVTASDVITRVRLNNGTLTISGSDEYAQVARANPSLFKLTDRGNGLITVTEKTTVPGVTDWSEYALYGGLALGAILLLKNLRG